MRPSLNSPSRLFLAHAREGRAVHTQQHDMATEGKQKGACMSAAMLYRVCIVAGLIRGAPLGLKVMVVTQYWVGLGG